ncbi:MAG: acyl-ACP--UDP-N-acetylglucosamine O-acyltransferase [Thermoguttaceae bacterium]
MIIHPTAIVSPNAQIGLQVEIGPFSIIEEDVVVGDGCQIDSHVVIKSGTVLGIGNRIGKGTVIGGPPQHTSAKPPFGFVVIGNQNTFRENVTVHRALKSPNTTCIGDENYFMANAHIAHDCNVGNNNVLVNNVMLGGHVQVGNRVNFGGAVGVHQFCRIGSLAMVGGQAHVIQDVPPFVTVDGLTSRIVGLNLIGLRRNGRSVEDIHIIKEVYRLIFRSGLTWKEILSNLETKFAVGAAAEMTQFLQMTNRGIVSERRSTARPSLRLVDSDDDISETNDAVRPLRSHVG